MNPLFLLGLFVVGGGALVAATSSSDAPKPQNPLDLSGLRSLFGQLGPVAPAGMSAAQKAAMDEIGRKAKAEFAAKKQKFIDDAARAGEAIYGETGGAFMRTLAKIGTAFTGGPEKWFTDEQYARANNAIINMLTAGLRPQPFDYDLHAGYEGYADVLELELSLFRAMPQSQQDRWLAFAKWLYDNPTIADPAGFPWDMFSLLRNDAQLAAFGRAYALSLNAPQLGEQYAAQAVRIGRWLRATMPYRSTSGTYKGLGILLDNIDRPSFGAS